MGVQNRVWSVGGVETWGSPLIDVQGEGEGLHTREVVVEDHHYVSVTLIVGVQDADHSIDVTGHMVIR